MHNGHFIITIRNENAKIIKKIPYTDRYYSGYAMADEEYFWKKHYQGRGKNVSISVESV